MTEIGTHPSASLHLCALCQKPTAASFHRVFKAPVCPTCLVQHASNTANESECGESDGLPMFSIEFEVRGKNSSESERALLLLTHGYVRTHDCTVDDEYKSPRYRSLAAFQQVLPVFEQLKDLVNPFHCGTHIHIDCPVKRIVNEFHWAIFGSLIKYLETRPKETGVFWGRLSTHALASPSTCYHTIEFRKPCFRTSAQYLAVVQFCRQIGQYLDNSLNETSPTYTPRPLELIGTDLVALYQQALANIPVQQEVFVHV
jgi:hypothetical protein